MKIPIKLYTTQQCPGRTGPESKDQADLITSFERTFGFSDDAYYLADNEGRIITGNNKLKEISGYEIRELVGKSFLEIELLSFQQKLRVAKLIATDRKGLPIGPEEFVLTRKDGRQVPVEACANILDKEKLGKFMFVLIRDLTGEKNGLYKHA
ncbi:MAG: PAS domain S-box protein [Firmicutes bacterium]|nr:PAS domain S-box protein [Bacillota bacterium]